MQSSELDKDGGSVTVANVIADLERSLTPMIEGERLDDAKRERQLAGLGESERAVTGRLFEYARRLSELTAWPEATLLEQIGCTIRSEEELQTLPKERLDNCERFLQFLCAVSEDVSPMRNRRTATRTCAELAHQTNRDAAGLEELCAEGDPSPREYLRLGEPARAARAARQQAGRARPEDEVSDGPYPGRAPLHLSPSRLEAFVREERELLGEQVFENIEAHLAECVHCHDAARRHGGRNGIG